ncbi:hypothetical protein [Salipiger abyssi]|uniref:hypothetical protein n=1 Tax=Salipiger abyssi TaxID=1250539 RepID=UPI001A908E38|nr:hypothetical protein [Salipiger abyssi]MBN9886433.1 hypothetical protein [Salipiger abyssi]
MILFLLHLSFWQPLGFQKENAAEHLIQSMARDIVPPDRRALFEETDCSIWDTVHFPPHVVPGRVIDAGETVSLLCEFPTSCGVTGERVVFHTEYYGAWKPAESFSHTIWETCAEMLTHVELERLSDIQSSDR